MKKGRNRYLLLRFDNVGLILFDMFFNSLVIIYIIQDGSLKKIDTLSPNLSNKVKIVLGYISRI